jgi:hypothetical protein
MRKSEEVQCAVVTIGNGEQITLNIGGRMPVSGKSMFGEYKIPLEKIYSIFEHVENERNLDADALTDTSITL